MCWRRTPGTMVRLRAAGGSRFPGKYGGRLPVAALRILHEHPRHGPRRRGGIRRRVRSRARRHQPFPGTDEPYPGDIPGRRRCRGGTRSYHSGSPAGSPCSGMVLPAGPGLQKGMQHRRKHRHERRRPQMPEIWSHQSLRAGADRGACQRRGSGMRRTHP